MLKGKLPYMSPEQIRGEPLDARSDVFALGILLWEALTGARLFARDSDLAICEAIATIGTPPTVGDAAVDAVIARALARDREARFASAKDMGQALRALAGTQADVAAFVTARFAARLAEQQRVIADAIAHGPTLDPVHAATSSIGLRAASVAIAPRRRGIRVVALAAAAITVVAGVWLALRGDPPSAPVPDAAIAIHVAPAPDAAVADAAPDAPPPDVRLARVAPNPDAAPPAPRAPGSYSVDSHPYATIYVDGKLLGDTPLFRLPIAAGHHRIRAVRQDGTERTFELAVAPGEAVNAGQLAW